MRTGTNSNFLTSPSDFEVDVSSFYQAFQMRVYVVYLFYQHLKLDVTVIFSNGHIHIELNKCAPTYISDIGNIQNYVKYYILLNLLVGKFVTTFLQMNQSIYLSTSTSYLLGLRVSLRVTLSMIYRFHVTSSNIFFSYISTLTS